MMWVQFDKIQHWKAFVKGSCAAYLVLAALMLYQSWMALGLFGSEAPWRRLLNEQPLLSGLHPQHFYLGTLGADALLSRGKTCCYDTNFQAGYPKTPIFNGSRIAELLLYVADEHHRAAAYKIGVMLLCLAVPILLFVSSRSAGLPPATSCLATAAGLLIWWGYPARTALESGKVDLLLASLAALAHVCLLVQFDRLPSLLSWFGLVLAGTLGCLAQPLFCPFMLLIFLVYYLSAGLRHVCPTWHFALLFSQVLPILLNAFWLLDWLAFWWLRVPMAPLASLFEPRPVSDLWAVAIWGSEFDMIQAAVLTAAALIGILVLHFAHERVAARLFLISILTLLVPAFFRIWSEPFGAIGTTDLFISILWFAAIPAAITLARMASLLCLLTRSRMAVGVLLSIAGAGSLAYGYYRDPELVTRYCRSTPLVIGLDQARLDFVQQLKSSTGTSARILWEDRQLGPATPFWSALLPLLTGRTFIGGFDPFSTIEHSSLGLVGEWLESKQLRLWSDESLDEYCRRYNVGWVVCTTAASAARFRDWNNARVVQTTDEGTIFAVNRPHSFTLKGQARLIHADSHSIMLADVVPENDVVVLSFHYQSGLRALPTRVGVEREPDGDNLIGFIRLRMSSPAARVTLTWGR